VSLIERCDFKYPRLFECETWLEDYLKDMGDKGDLYSAVTQARREIIEEKYKGFSNDKSRLARLYSDVIEGSLMSFPVYDMPLLFRRTDGKAYKSYFTNRSIREPRYDVDRIRSIFGWRLTEFLLRRRRSFLCPFYHTTYCTVKVDRCQHSYSDLRDVPANQECRVRQTCFDNDAGCFKL
jgi:hypothetical protein